MSTESEMELQSLLVECGRWASGDPSPEPGSSRLEAGGAWPWRTGHFEVTNQVAERFGFTAPATDILRDASQDPDFHEFLNPAAHAQSPDGTDILPMGAERDRVVESAVMSYLEWIEDKVGNLQSALDCGDLRTGLYWLGYALHAVEDLAPHLGRTNAEHAAEGAGPDRDTEAVELASHHACVFLRAVLDRVGDEGFNALRSYRGMGRLGRAEKQQLHGGTRDLCAAAVAAYLAGGRRYSERRPAPAPVRWNREQVLRRIVERVATPGGRGNPEVDAMPPVRSRGPAFEPLVASPAPASRAAWTVMVYMAGDDQSPNGIEYAVRQDLHEMKELGSTDRVHLIAQTDEHRETSSFRYRLRKGTSLRDDRLEVFRGDVNTGQVSTLTEFVRWSASRYPAERYALVLWGHGSGHDDKDVYRLARGGMSPRIATQVARGRLGFFGATRRAMIERCGPRRGFGFDSTASDFLDNSELRRALQSICTILGKPLDLLGFDACLMATVEVGYQARDLAHVLVASQRIEPGDGWCYRTALAGLVARPETGAEGLARDIVGAYRATHGDRWTLSAVRLERLPALGQALARVAASVDPRAYDAARRAAEDCSSRAGGGNRDLGDFLTALGDRAARDALGEALIVASGARTSGLGIYLPADFRPDLPGGTDEAYEQHDFARDCGWAAMLRRIYPVPPRTREPEPAPLAGELGSAYGLDLYNLPAALSGARGSGTGWADRARAEVIASLDEHVSRYRCAPLPAPDEGPLRVFVLPGTMGSMLSDRAGDRGLVWFDPVGLAYGDDYEALRLSPGGMADADSGVRLEAVGSVPLVYDSLSLKMIQKLGSVVEHVPYDWRRSIASQGAIVAARIRKFLDESPNRRAVLVAHSMGGLVAGEALAALGDTKRQQVAGLVALGVPWKGAPIAAMSLRGEGTEIEYFSRLLGRDPVELADVAQTFWGLTDLLPTDKPEILVPEFFKAGPLFSGGAEGNQLASPGSLHRVPDVPILNIVGKRVRTPSRLWFQGGTVSVEFGPGDGTVPFWSATADSTIPSRISYHGLHRSLPLDAEVIRLTIARIQEWAGLGDEDSAKALAGSDERERGGEGALLPSPSEGPADRESLLAQLEEIDFRPLPVGTVTALMPFL